MYGKLKGEMENLGFAAGNRDITIFFRYEDNGNTTIISWYVDDGLIASTGIARMNEAILDISSRFTIQDLRVPSHLLSIKIDRNCNDGTIKISQPAFINSITNQGWVNCQNVNGDIKLPHLLRGELSLL